MKIAVLGAGFCGMAVAWNLLQTPGIEVTILDKKGIAKGTSSIAAGLLHPYVGAHSKLNWQAAEGMAATNKLIMVAEKALGKQVAYREGMIRLALSEEQTVDFAKCANLYKDVQWRTNEDCERDAPQVVASHGIFIDSAITVDCENYLLGLWEACQQKGAVFEKASISSLKELDCFDYVVAALGANTSDILELSSLPIVPTKGQVLEYAWPNNLSPLPYPINSLGYLLMNPNHKSCIVGSSYEKEFADDAPNIEMALKEIMPKVTPFFPNIQDFELINCKAGVRAGMPGRKPYIGCVDKKYWVLTGMGSKGLLYHALFAEELSKRLLAEG